MGSGVTIRPSGPRSTRLAPPNTAGATLSAWPSSSLQSSTSPAASSGRSSSAAAAAAPATVAAAEEPSPRAMGMSDSATSARPAGTSRPARRQAAAKPRYSRSASGAVSRARSVPPRSITTGFPPRVAWAVTRSQRPTATPTQSNPAPRLDVEPGTRTVTLGRMRGPASPGNRKARERRPRAARFLAPCLTWRQYAANHHDHFGCMFIVTAGAGHRQGPRRARRTRSGAMTKLRVGILGATGTVGQRFLQLLEDHPHFVVTALAASDRSRGKPYAEACAWYPVISNSSSHRMDDQVPLLVPEVNPAHLAALDACRDAGEGGGFIVTNPNCSTVMIALAL